MNIATNPLSTENFEPLSIPSTFKVQWGGRGHNYTEDEIQTVVEIMKSSDTLTQGKYQVDFEKKFSEYLGVDHAFAVATCASALELSALLCRLKPGDEVIAPAHTFAVSAYPFARYGAKIKWADINPQTFVIDPKSIEKLITDKTRVIVVVHLYGVPAPMDEIMSLAKKHRLLVVEDVAQAIGATYNGKKVGSHGDFACFSFHTQKNMTTLGEGGVLVVKDPELAKVVPGFRHNGMRPYPSDRPFYWKPAMSNVDFDWEGVWPYNFCVNEVQCGLASKLLERIDQMNEQRKSRYDFITNELSNFSELTFQKIPGNCQSAYHLLPARFRGKGKTRDDLIYLLATKFGVKCVVQYYPLYRYPMFQKAGFGDANCPETDLFFDNMISFPFTLTLSDDQISYMVDAIKKALITLRT